jgi:hypothetical protein
MSDDQPADPLGDTELARMSAGARFRPANKKTRRYLEIAACVVEAVLVWGVSLGVAAAVQDEQTMTLKGLPGVTVVVTPIGADVERDGLLAAQLQADVERTLRSAGVPVLTLVDQREIPNAPRLRVTVLTYKGGDGVAAPYFYAYTITVRLFQRARLVNSAAALTPFVATWEGSTAMGVWPPESIGGLLKLVKDRVNQFANAWRAVHPKG